MKCTEKGVLEKSTYYFYAKNPAAYKYHYYTPVCGHFYCKNGYSIKRGGGVTPLFFYIVHGQLDFVYEDKNHCAKENQLVLLDCNKAHEYFCSDSCEFVFFHFDGADSYELTKFLIQQNKNIVFNVENPGAILKKMLAVTDALDNGTKVSEIELSSLVYECLCSLSMGNSSNEIERKSSCFNAAKVISYIRSNISNDFTLEELAEQANLSKFHFSRVFKEETGITPLEYVAQTKINLAETILITTTRPVSEIAYDLGYSSESSFINAFKSRTNMSPGQFRKVQQSE